MADDETAEGAEAAAPRPETARDDLDDGHDRDDRDEPEDGDAGDPPDEATRRRLRPPSVRLPRLPARARRRRTPVDDQLAAEAAALDGLGGPDGDGPVESPDEEALAAAAGPPGDVAPEPPPGLPEGRSLDLGARGTTWVYDLPGPSPEAPTLVLLHGWTANAALNWFPSFGPLAERWRVVALDHRGHGRGIRSRRRFRLEDCADDVAAAADALGVDRFVPVGYSMGGPVAQLVWQRHRERVAGLVLCATAPTFRGRPGERVLFSMMSAAALMVRATPGGVRHRLNERLVAERGDDSALAEWWRSELRRNDPRMVIEAGQAIGQFSSVEWIGGVDVPTAVVVTEFDAVVPPHRQERLARAISGATVHRVRGNHSVCAARPQNFVPELVEACESVTARAARRERTAG